MDYRFSNQVSEQVSEQMGPVFAPMLALWDANLKAFESVLGQQAQLLDEVVVSCSELADDLSKADSLETVWTLHKKCSSKLQGIYVDSIKKTPQAFKESEALMVEALENAGDFSALTAEFEKVTQASPAKPAKKAAATKPAAKKTTAKKKTAKKAEPQPEAASEPVKAEEQELETHN